MAVADMMTTGGPHDVIALPAAARGHSTTAPCSRCGVVNSGSTGQDRLDRDEDVMFESKVRMPDEFAGHAMVFRTFDKVSYALVMSSVKPTRVGYELKHPDAPY
jgi:hypothetical protein